MISFVILPRTFIVFHYYFIKNRWYAALFRDYSDFNQEEALKIIILYIFFMWSLSWSVITSRWHFMVCRSVAVENAGVVTRKGTICGLKSSAEVTASPPKYVFGMCSRVASFNDVLRQLGIGRSHFQFLLPLRQSVQATVKSVLIHVLFGEICALVIFIPHFL